MYRQLPQIEKKHWWFIGRRLLVESALKKAGFKKGKRALDLGCGTGGNLAFLKKFCPSVLGLDFSKLALKIARKKQPRSKFIQADLNQLEKIFPEEKFDLITIFNVLYHRWVKNEEKVLEQSYSILKPGGILVMTEPAFNWLKRSHDTLDMAKKRYRLIEFKRVFKKTGFQPIKMTYFNSFGLLPALILKIVETATDPKQQKAGANELNLPPPLLNKLLLMVFRLEIKLINVLGSLPLGVTLFCLVQKPPGAKKN